MSKKKKYVLPVILLLLLGILFIVKITKPGKPDSTFKTDIINIDSASVNKIIISPLAEQHAEITFIKDKDLWYVQKDNIKVKAQAGSVQSILSQLSSLKPTRLASRSKEQWKDFNVTDSLATKVKVMEGSKVALNLLIGKFSYRQKNMAAYNNRNVQGISYIRLDGEDKTYAVQGFLPMTFNQKFNSWRNQQLLKTDKTKISKVVFKYPADSGFVLTLADSTWLIDGQKADSANTEQLLNTLSYRSCNSFKDGYTPPDMANYTLDVSSDSIQLYHVQAYILDSDEVVLHSGINPDAWFSSPVSGIFAQIFKNKEFFLKKK